ncbi:ABC transporter permease [Corynebacterium ulceribovis]|uniref:ABC transporter permease n=1 Tax=Corynebacterium ulceribovis TaxID=487732 RepID=UPI00037CA9BB|nr:ABC transporter permease [Corynebacterium ulceribovis]
MSKLDLKPRAARPVADWFSDVGAIITRNLQGMRQTPDVLIWAMAQPIMFVLLFSQVYGGAIKVPGMDYTDFLMAGIFAQTMLFGSTFSGMFMAQDKKEGIIDRFRTLPMHDSAILFARTISDMVLNAITITVMVLCGFAVGWRFHEGIGSFVAGIGLLLLFAWAFSWVMVFLGLIVRSPEALNSASFMVLFPLSFVSNAFVPSDTLPTALRIFAEWNPVSALVQAARVLFGNTGGTPAPDLWTMQHPVLAVLIGCVLVAGIFMPLSVLRFKRN